MAQTVNNYMDVKAVRKTKVETTYEYVPIIGEILGYWRKVEAKRAGMTAEIYINTPLMYYDRLVINGEEIEIPHKTIAV